MINFDDINSDTNYSAMVAYGQSKLANVLFSKELAQRLEGKMHTIIRFIQIIDVIIINKNNNNTNTYRYWSTRV